MVALDLSQPLSTLLREGTKDAHHRIEHSQGAALLINGGLEREEYARWLIMLWHVYDSLERALDKHASHPTLAPTYNPGLLSRLPTLVADIAYFLDVSESSWQTHPLAAAFLADKPLGVVRYVARLEELANAADPSPLLAHAYVRYLGDLSGGQIIRRRVEKAYALEDGAGLAFYDFKPLGGAGGGGARDANIGDMRKIKDWYRDNMDAGARDDRARKAAIVEEANVAFDMNAGLFDELQPAASSSSGEESEAESPAVTPGDEVAEPPLAGSKVVYAASPTDWLFSATSVITFMLTVGIAHFILVTGGFIGTPAVAKWEALDAWIRGVVAAN